MLALLLTTPTDTRGVVAPVRTVDVAAIAAAAKVKETPAPVEGAENLSEIVHSRERPQGTRPPQRTRATTPSSNASTRGDPGLGGEDSGPYSLVRSRRSCDVLSGGANYTNRAGCSDFRAFRCPSTRAW